MNREDILATARAAAAPVPFDECGLDIHLRPLAASEMIEAQRWQEAHGDENGYQFLFVRAVCDPDGRRQLRDEDAPLVADFPSHMVEAVVKRIRELTRLGEHEKKVRSTARANSSSHTG